MHYDKNNIFAKIDICELNKKYNWTIPAIIITDEIFKITHNLNQEEPQEWLSQNDWKSHGCESFFEGTLIISLVKQK